MEKLFSIYRSHIWEYAHKHKISLIQIQFLKFLKKHRPKFCTVSNLSREFPLSKATISDAIKSLIKKGYVKKISNQNDLRIKCLTLTNKGSEILKNLDSLNDIFISALKNFQIPLKELFLIYLMNLLRILVAETKTPILRICINCENFEFNRFPDSDTPHFCKSLNLKMAFRDLRIDCLSNKRASEINEDKLKDMEPLFS